MVHDMKSTATVRKVNTFPLVGASIGLLVFLAVALVPSLVCGGLAGVQLASAVLGVPATPTFSVDAFIILGIVSAVIAVGSLFAALGAVAGATVGALIRGTGVATA
jgi:hypothetical protein